MFGPLGSLSSRIEDTQTVAGPITVLMVLAYFVSFATIGSPDSMWAQLVSFFPVTAPLAMPARMAMGDPAWWEPVLAATIALSAIVALVRLRGRLHQCHSPVGANSEAARRVGCDRRMALV